VSRLIEGYGVPSMGAFNVLTIVGGARGPIAPSVVAARMVVSRPTVTGLLDTLERRGLVERRAHGTDGRMKLVDLTDEGRRLVAEMLPVVHRFEKEVMGCLDETRQRALLGLLTSLQHHLPTVTDLPLGIRD
jgi:DNA-binding MarR family transcriptional regulator